MRRAASLLSALLGLAPLAPAQRFGFTHQAVPADTGDGQDVALGDVDGDGDLDAYVGSAGQDRLLVNDGTGTFADATATNLPVLLDDTSGVAVGDLDGDGDLDVFVGNAGQDRLLQNGGTGVFADATAASLPAFAGTTAAVALGDLDGDGDLDAYVGDLVLDRLYLNLGGGVFSDVSGTNLPGSAAATTAVALGDADGDGDLDALAGSAGQQTRLYLNGGTGAFTDVTATNLPPSFDRTRGIAMGDVDGDGDLDAFVRNGMTSPWIAPFPDRLLLNLGTGTFTDASATNLPSVSWFEGSVALGDLDGDGDLDAVLGTFGPDPSYLNVGAGVLAYFPGAALSPLGDKTRAVALGDLDGDGDLDAFTVNAGAQDRLFLNGGTAAFVDATASDLPDALGPTRAVALGDVDGDGDPDAVLGQGGAGLYLNAGDGTFADVSGANLPPPTGITEAVALGDVDGDGDLDAWIGNSGYSYLGQDLLYRNGGTGIFTDVTATSLPVLSDYTSGVALGDLDGDSDLDAFVGSTPVGFGATTPSRLFLNNGAGVFTDVTATNLPGAIGFPRAVALGDVDGDGDLDAYAGHEYYDRLYVNNGAGAFADATAASLPVLVDLTYAVALADVDADGDLDAFTGNGEPAQPQQDRLFLNGGAGIFADATAANLPAILGSTRSVALGDVDEDGDLDAFLGTRGTNGAQNRLYENLGAGVFSDVTATEMPALTELSNTASLADVDGDGDLDAFVGVLPGQNRLWRNLTRQLAWRGIPRAGKTLALELQGPASGGWLLAASAGTSNIPLPPFGTLRLLPSTLFIVAGGALDPQGSASVSFVVPANPALVGLSLYWQAVVGSPFRFTNLEVTTVTGL